MPLGCLGMWPSYDSPNGHWYLRRSTISWPSPVGNKCTFDGHILYGSVWSDNHKTHKTTWDPLEICSWICSLIKKWRVTSRPKSSTFDGQFGQQGSFSRSIQDIKVSKLMMSISHVALVSYHISALKTINPCQSPEHGSSRLACQRSWSIYLPAAYAWELRSININN